jgi:hypothetical protein
VTRTFEAIFRRENIRAAVIEGDSFHRFDRKEMRVRMAEAEQAGDKHFSHFGPGARETFAEYLGLRLQQPHFANARSVRNALDRARLRQASRLFADRDRVLGAEDLTTLLPSDIRASRVFAAATAGAT